MRPVLLALALALPTATHARTVVVGNTLGEARAKLAEAGAEWRDCDPARDGTNRWLCADFVDPVPSDLRPPASRAAPTPSEPSAEITVYGETLEDSRRLYAAVTDLPRADCDPYRGGYLCSSIRDPRRPTTVRIAPVPAPAPEPAPAPAPVSVPVPAPAPAPAPAPVPAPESPPAPAPAPAPEPEPEPTIPETPEPPPIAADACPADSIDAINGCIDAGASTVAVTRDIRCTSGRCEIAISGRTDVTLDGRGRTITRTVRTKDNPVLRIDSGSGNVVVRNLSFDDLGDPSNACPVFCNRMVFVHGANDVVFDRVSVSNARSYALYVQRTDGFTFTNGAVTGAGVLGLYVGLGFDGESSRRIRIEGGRFVRNATNGIAVHGATDVVIVGNDLERNHLYGRFAPSARGFSPGGQLYLAGAIGAEVSGNRIVDGSCLNCSDPRGSVHGIELGELGAQSLRDIEVFGNTLIANDNCAIIKNPSSRLDGSTRIYGNRLSGNRCDIKADGAQVFGNAAD